MNLKYYPVSECGHVFENLEVKNSSGPILQQATFKPDRCLECKKIINSVEIKAPKIDDLIYKGLIEEDWNAIKDAMTESSVSLISDCQKYKDTMSKESIDRDMGKANRLIYLIW